MSEARPHCQIPHDCRAKGRKHCLSCARKLDWANPEIRARKLADIDRCMQTPESITVRVAARRRCTARRYVLAAGLPLFRRTVDRARALLDAGEPRELIAASLRTEAR